MIALFISQKQIEKKMTSSIQQKNTNSKSPKKVSKYSSKCNTPKLIDGKENIDPNILNFFVQEKLLSKAKKFISVNDGNQFTLPSSEKHKEKTYPKTPIVIYIDPICNNEVKASGNAEDNSSEPISV